VKSKLSAILVIVILAASVTFGSIIGLLVFGTPSDGAGGGEESAITQVLSEAAMTATALCSVDTGSNYVLAYEIWGTPTPRPTREGATPLPPTATATLSVQDYVPSVENGQVLFNGVGQCNACHFITTEQNQLGPSLAGVAVWAGERVPGMSAHDYLRDVIVDPWIVPPAFSTKRGVMPVTYAYTLTDTQIEDIVAYMLTLK
jgi:mono/diheme cytochrome c family protein